ncbi:hypothetical protein ATANTOWER_015619 [Ataeniobius toweri]|uniref:Uncharacterized protein n=1 Tax=Ataeniobius toweri TaxID=208326 RepID=A0ABU7CGV9_9TELE|nr:hypothetical protein [Ataeniobius toweri]
MLAVTRHRLVTCNKILNSCGFKTFKTILPFSHLNEMPEKALRNSATTKLWHCPSSTCCYTLPVSWLGEGSDMSVLLYITDACLKIFVVMKNSHDVERSATHHPYYHDAGKLQAGGLSSS